MTSKGCNLLFYFSRNILELRLHHWYLMLKYYYPTYLFMFVFYLSIYLSKYIFWKESSFHFVEKFIFFRLFLFCCILPLCVWVILITAPHIHTHTPLSYKAYNTQTKERNYVQQLQIHHTHQNTQKHLHTSNKTYTHYHWVHENQEDKQNSTFNKHIRDITKESTVSYSTSINKSFLLYIQS